MHKVSPVSETVLFLFFRDQVFASQIKTEKEICWVTLTSLRASFKSPISCAKSNTWSLHYDSPVSKTVSFLFFFRDQVFAPLIKTMEEICWVTPTPLKASFKSPIPYAKSNTQSAHKDNPESKIVLSSLFWGTKSLRHRSRLRKRFLGVTPTPLRVSFKSPISCTKSSTWSVHKDSPVSETVLFLFSRDQVFASQIKTKEGICWVTPTPLWASLSLLGKVKHLISTWRQPNVRNSFFFLHCLGTKSLYHRSRLRKRLFGQHCCCVSALTLHSFTV